MKNSNLSLPVILFFAASPIFSQQSLAAQFPPITPQITQLQNGLDTSEQSQYRGAFVDKIGNGLLVSIGGLSRLSDGKFVSASQILIDAGLAKPSSYTYIFGSQVSPDGKCIALSLTVGDSYSAWQNCSNPPYGANAEECFGGKVVIDTDTLKLTNRIIGSSNLSNSVLAKESQQNQKSLEALVGEAIDIANGDPIFSKDGSRILQILIGRVSRGSCPHPRWDSFEGLMVSTLIFSPLQS